MSSYDGMNIIDEQGIDLIISKQQYFNIALLNNNSEILDAFSEINLNYISDINSDRLVSLQTELFNKLSIMQKNHNNNLRILSKNRDKYINTSEYVSKLFDDIEQVGNE